MLFAIKWSMICFLVYCQVGFQIQGISLDELVQKVMIIYKVRKKLCFFIASPFFIFSPLLLSENEKNLKLISFQIGLPVPVADGYHVGFVTAHDKLQGSSSLQGLFSIPESMCFEKY